MSEKAEPEHHRKLFIGGLDYKSTEESLQSYFEKWGEVVDCVVMRDPQTRKSRGFGFITYKEAQMVDDAQASRPHKIDGRQVQVKRAVPRENAGKPEAEETVSTLYVSGINDDLGEEDLREYFSSYGNIVSVRVITDKDTGKKRGFAFVEFDDYDPVDKIVLRRHNCKGMPLEVKKSVSRAGRGNSKMGGFGGRGRLRSGGDFNRRGGGYDRSFQEDFMYGDCTWTNDFGSSSGGPMRGGGYTQRNQGPYGGGRRGYGRRN